MELKIISKKESPLLKRTEVSAEATYDASTPTRQDIKKAASKLLSTDEKLVVIEKITPRYGTRAAKITIHVYKDEQSLKKTESPHILKRMEGKKKQGAAEEKA